MASRKNSPPNPVNDIPEDLLPDSSVSSDDTLEFREVLTLSRLNMDCLEAYLRESVIMAKYIKEYMDKLKDLYRRQMQLDLPGGKPPSKGRKKFFWRRRK